MMKIKLIVTLLSVICVQYAIAANYYDDQAGDDNADDGNAAAADDGNAAAADDGNAAAADDNADDGKVKYYGYYGVDDNVNEYYTSGGATYSEYKGDYTGDDLITYWTEYAIQAKKCITYNNKDMMVFSMYEKYYNHCKDKPIGTYMVDVPTFITALVEQKDLNAADLDTDDYESPDVTYVNCYPLETDNGVYYVQLGCTDGNSQSLSVNVYKDNTCETPDKNEHGIDDTNIDVSSLQPSFKSCHQCVYFVDKNEDDVDDQYFDNRMTSAPLCSTSWENKQVCNGKCKRLGNAESGWNSTDQILMTFLSLFGAAMLAVISKKRTKMAKKDALLEEAAMSAAGLQQTHVIGLFVLTLIITVLFGLMGLKSFTWGLLLLLNLILFCYLMKLTIDSGLNAPVGPDGELIGYESSDEEDDDDDEEEDNENGVYKPPATPADESAKPESLPEII